MLPVECKPGRTSQEGLVRRAGIEDWGASWLWDHRRREAGESESQSSPFSQMGYGWKNHCKKLQRPGSSHPHYFLMFVCPLLHFEGEQDLR